MHFVISLNRKCHSFFVAIAAASSLLLLAVFLLLCATHTHKKPTTLARDTLTKKSIMLICTGYMVHKQLQRRPKTDEEGNMEYGPEISLDTRTTNTHTETHAQLYAQSKTK